MLAALVLALAVGAWLWWQFVGRRKNYPPGPIPLPIIGNVGQMDMSAPHRWVFKKGQEYGGIFTTFLGGEATVWVTDEALIREIFVGKTAEAAAGRPYNALFSMLSRGRYGIINTDGAQWKEHRRFALHTFRNLGLGKNVMEKKIHSVLEEMLQHVAQELPEGQGSLNMDPHMELCVGNIISELVMSTRFSKDSEFQELKSGIDTNFKLLGTLPAIVMTQLSFLRHIPGVFKTTWQELEANRNRLNAYMKKIIEEKKKILDLDAEPDDYASAYLKEAAVGDSSLYSMAQLESAIADFWIAGLETTITTIKWGILYMLHHPEIQTALRAEIHNVCGGQRLPSMSDKPRLPLLSATLNEVQRCCHLVYINLMHRATEDIRVGKYVIKAGTTMCPQISAAHLDPRLYPEPDSFNPRRFLSADGTTVIKDENLNPFSIGKRQCAGESLARMELFLIFGALIQRYEFNVAEGQVLPSLAPVIGFTATPQHFNVHVNIL